ncbi:MAG: LacI family transcriptional regulator [Clostridiales bacterium]|nr:LacI family transcriptional regulator [Clostridiales bacterium]
MTEKKTLTIHDIARLADVSPTTVSFVLNERKGISDETRSRVQGIIEQTGFTPNIHTRRLNLKKSFNVSVVMQEQASSLHNMYFLEIIFGILSEGNKLGYNILFATLANESDRELLLGTINNKSTDGLIFLEDMDPDTLSIVKESGIPHLVVDSHLRDKGVYPQVQFDYFEASFAATEYLIKAGHEQIAFISMKQSPDYYTSTFEGYKTALLRYGLHLEPTWVQSDASDETSAAGCMRNILESDSARPTAVFCAGDIYAVGAMKCAKEYGLSVPGDISFIGIDDLILSPYIDPPLTTMSVNERLMGQTAMQMMYDILNGMPGAPATTITGTIIERASVKRLAKT